MSTLKFGSFELEADSLELRQHGSRVSLRPQPCAVLVYLAERAERFVSRAELHRHLWGDGTHVRFDQGLNSCIKQIRRALGDSPSSPSYLETLPRRGYRFLKRVEVVAGEAPAPVPLLGSDMVGAIARLVARELRTRLERGGASKF